MTFLNLISNKKILEISSNFFYLASSQILNYVIPILIIPILLKRIGLENVGKVATYQALFIYISILIDFGFNLIGTAEVAKRQDDIESIQNLFSSVTTSKLYLLVIGILILTPIIFQLYPNELEWIVVVCSLLVAGFGNILFSEWLFHGMKIIKFQFISLFISKIVYFVVVYIFIVSPKDYLKVVYFEALSYMLVGIISSLIIRFILKIKFRVANIENVKLQLLKGWYPFLSNAFTTIYTTGNILILGFLSGQIEVAKYTIAIRSFFIINGLFSLSNRIIYPYLSSNFNDSYQSFIKIIRAYSKGVFVGALFISIIFYNMSEIIIRYLSNSNNEYIVFIFKILCINIIFSPFNSLLTNIIIIEQRSRIIAKINLIGVLISLTVTLSLISFNDGLGLALGTVITNLVLLLFCIKETNYITLIFKPHLYGFRK